MAEMALSAALMFLLVLSVWSVEGQSTTEDSSSCVTATLLGHISSIVRRELRRVDTNENCRQREEPASVSQQLLVLALKTNCIPLLIQQNVDGSDFFNRSWAEFKAGFNDSGGNYWLGNELLHQLTKDNGYKLKCDLRARSSGKVYVAEYNTFLVGTEASNYTLTVALYSGNAGDSMAYHNGRMFTTYNRDNDSRGDNCAAFCAGGFWYGECFQAGFTVMKGRGGGFSWYGLPASEGRFLSSTRMWLTCR